jgi:curved DNA-binding protein CbpA
MIKLVLLFAAAIADYYDDLGVSKDSSFDEITSAFKTLAVLYHPDKNTD